MTTQSELIEFPDQWGPTGVFIPLGGYEEDEEPVPDPETELPSWNSNRIQ